MAIAPQAVDPLFHLLAALSLRCLFVHLVGNHLASLRLPRRMTDFALATVPIRSISGFVKTTSRLLTLSSVFAALIAHRAAVQILPKRLYQRKPSSPKVQTTLLSETRHLAGHLSINNLKYPPRSSFAPSLYDCQPPVPPCRRANYQAITIIIVILSAFLQENASPKPSAKKASTSRL